MKKYWSGPNPCSAFIRTIGPTRFSHGKFLLNLSHTDHVFAYVVLFISVIGFHIPKHKVHIFVVTPTKVSSWENIDLGITHQNKLRNTGCLDFAAQTDFMETNRNYMFLSSDPPRYSYLLAETGVSS